MSHLFSFELMEPWLVGEAGVRDCSSFQPCDGWRMNLLSRSFSEEANHILSNNLRPATGLRSHALLHRPGKAHDDIEA